MKVTTPSYLLGNSPLGTSPLRLLNPTATTGGEPAPDTSAPASGSAVAATADAADSTDGPVPGGVSKASAPASAAIVGSTAVERRYVAHPGV